MTEYYTKMEVARMLRVSRMTVTRWLRSGQLSGMRGNKRGDWIIPKANLDAMLARMTKEGNE